MPTFEYQAQGVDGQVVKGHVIGASIDQAVTDLASRGLQILNIGVAVSAGDPLSQLGRSSQPHPSVSTPPVPPIPFPGAASAVQENVETTRMAPASAGATEIPTQLM